MDQHEVTTGDIMDFLQEHMVVKKDLEGLASQENVDRKFDFLYANMATKQDLENLATKEELQDFKSEVITTIDRFAKLHETLDQELVFMRHRQDRLEERLVVVEQKLGFSV